MRRLIVLAAAALLLSSCGVSSLYYWGGTQSGATAYENLAYQSYDKQTPKSLCKLVALYEKMITKPGGLRQVPPPGICAEYGYLLLQGETAVVFAENASASEKQLFKTDDYGAFFAARGKEMLEKEMEYYPESVKFIQPLIKKLTK